jgi:hypothetical protein
VSDYACPECSKPLVNDPEHPFCYDADGKMWPAMACVTHGLFGRRDDGQVVPVEGSESE